MKIEAKLEDREEPKSNINVVLSGSGGDEKQPIHYVYTSIEITRKSARRLAAQLLKLAK